MFNILTIQFSLDRGGETWKLPKIETWRTPGKKQHDGQTKTKHGTLYNFRVGWFRTALGLHIGVTRVSIK